MVVGEETECKFGETKIKLCRKDTVHGVLISLCEIQKDYAKPKYYDPTKCLRYRGNVSLLICRRGVLQICHTGLQSNLRLVEGIDDSLV